MRALATANWHVARIGGGVWAVLAVGYLLHWTPAAWGDKLRSRFIAAPAPVQGLALAGVAAALALVAETDVVPFIYVDF